jgi:CubicO group peptidase (beta-lactamase class C family)
MTGCQISQPCAPPEPGDPRLRRRTTAPRRYALQFDMLGRLLEVASGERLDALLRRLIFEPLCM